jgi:hypothetical protein
LDAASCPISVRSASFASGDFFDAATIPIGGAADRTGSVALNGTAAQGLPPADVFVLKQIIHDHNDALAARILTNVRKAMIRAQQQTDHPVRYGAHQRLTRSVRRSPD